MIQSFDPRSFAPVAFSDRSFALGDEVPPEFDLQPLLPALRRQQKRRRERDDEDALVLLGVL